MYFLYMSQSRSIPSKTSTWTREIALLEISDKREQIKKLLINRIIPESHCPFAAPSSLVGKVI